MENENHLKRFSEEEIFKEILHRLNNYEKENKFLKSKLEKERGGEKS